MDPTDAGMAGEFVAGLTAGAAMVGAILARFLPRAFGGSPDAATTTQHMQAPEPTRAQLMSSIEAMRDDVREAKDLAQKTSNNLTTVRTVLDTVQAQTRELANTTGELSRTNASLSTLVEILKSRQP